VLVHAVLLGSIFCFRYTAPPAAEEMVVQAPLGDVFVEEQHAALPKPAEREVVPAPSPTERSTNPEAEPPMAVTRDSAPGSAGTPEGEAAPLGPIQPDYPAMSRKLGEEGEASFLLHLDESGTVTGAEMERSSGYPRLDQSALAALEGAKFQPASRGGKNIPSVKNFRVEFRLKGKP
jgi:protein TonB